MRRAFLKALAGTLVLVGTIGSAFAQADYPTRPITLVTSGIGGSIDVGARLLAGKLTERLHQRVVVENVPGDVQRNLRVTHAKPDGYTLLYSGQNMWISPVFDKNMGYDAVAGFVPISLVARTPVAFAVNAAMPVKSVAELLAYIKAHPGKVNFAIAPANGADTVSTKLFVGMTKVNILQVPYTSVSARMTAMLGDEVQAQIATAAGLTPFLTSPKIRILGVAAPEPSPLLPGIPIVGAALPGFEADSYNAVFAPPGTPPAIVARLNKDVVAVVNDPDTRKKFLASGLEPVGSSPQDLTKNMKATVQRVSKIAATAK